jgi:D-alanine-D-alanine ligase
MNPSFQYRPELLPTFLETWFKKLRLAVIYGGNKEEPESVIYRTHNTRPWKSYQTVAEDIKHALQELGFHQVYVLPDDMHLNYRLKELGIHMAWLNTGGVQGFNPLSHTPAVLEMLGIPYVGHNPYNASVLDNKHIFKQELQTFGFPTSPFITWHPTLGEFDSSAPYFQKKFAGYNGSYVVKPVSGRASLHVHVAHTLPELTRQVNEVYNATSNRVLIEQFLPGREFCVSVSGNLLFVNGQARRLPRPFAFSVIERKLDQDELIFTSMDKRAITVDRVRFLTEPADQPIRHKLVHLAQNIYHDMNLRSLIRLDVRCDEQGELFVLEANPKPDLKRPQPHVTSLVATGLTEYGMTYPDLILSLLMERIDYLLAYRPDTMQHLLDLLTPALSVPELVN